MKQDQKTDGTSVQDSLMKLKLWRLTRCQKNQFIQHHSSRTKFKSVYQFVCEIHIHDTMISLTYLIIIVGYI